METKMFYDLLHKLVRLDLSPISVTLRVHLVSSQVKRHSEMSSRMQLRRFLYQALKKSLS